MLPKKRGKRLPLKVRSVVDLHDFHAYKEKTSFLLIRTSNKYAMRFFVEVHSDDVAAALQLAPRDKEKETWAQFKERLLPELLLRRAEAVAAAKRKELRHKGRRS